MNFEEITIENKKIKSKWEAKKHEKQSENVLSTGNLKSFKEAEQQPAIEKMRSEEIDIPETKKCPRCGMAIEGPFCTECGANYEEAAILAEDEKNFVGNVKETLYSEKEFLENRAKVFGISKNRLEEMLKEIEEYLILENRKNINSYLNRNNTRDNFYTPKDNSKGSYGVLSKKIKINPELHNTKLDLVKTLHHEFTHLALNETLFENIHKRWFTNETGYKRKKKLDEEYDEFISSVTSNLNDFDIDRKKRDKNEILSKSKREEEIENALKKETEESVEIEIEKEKENREAQHCFFSFYKAFNEAAAYIGSRIIDKNHKGVPSFKKYDDQTEPKMFEALYYGLESVVKKINLDYSNSTERLRKFDIITQVVGEFVAKKWKRNLTMKEYEDTLSTVLDFLISKIDNKTDETQ